MGQIVKKLNLFVDEVLFYAKGTISKSEYKILNLLGLSKKNKYKNKILNSLC